MKTKFVFMGDPQCSRIRGHEPDYSDWERLLRHSVTKVSENSTKPLVVLGGDLVNRGGKREEWDAFFKACDRVRADYDYVMVSPTGIHGEQTPYPEVLGFRERFLLPGNGPFGHEDGFFSFDHGCAHFIVLDSNYMDNEDEAASKYLGAWIKHDLAANRQPSVFAVMHHPMYSIGCSLDDTLRAKAMQSNYQRLLFRYGVDMILCGHQHVYCRTNDRTQITQVMGVSGGKTFSAASTDAFAICVEDVACATLIETDGKTIELRSYDETGRCIDQHTQPTRPVKPRKCGTCEKFHRCGGTGIVEKEEAEIKAKKAGHSPLIPEYKGGITVNGTFFDRSMLQGFDWKEYVFSVNQKGTLRQIPVKGIPLMDLLPDGSQNIEEDTILTITNEDGICVRCKLADVLETKHYSADDQTRIVTEDGKVPAVVFIDGSDHNDNHRSVYRLAVGQQSPDQYAGRLWIRHIIAIKTSKQEV